MDSRFRRNDGVGEHPFDASDATTRGADGELRQPRFFDRALRAVKEYNEKVEYIHLNPLRAGLVSRPEDWSRPAGSSYNEDAGMSADDQILEDFPEHRRGACCLLNGLTDEGRALHIVCTTGQPLLILITAYEPRPPKWLTPRERRS